jgi:hypothetical protein
MLPMRFGEALQSLADANAFERSVPAAIYHNTSVFIFLERLEKVSIELFCHAVSEFESLVQRMSIVKPRVDPRPVGVCL